jgi:two-component system cell cycle sensor histidine kinase/response regulator CckA
MPMGVARRRLKPRRARPIASVRTLVTAGDLLSRFRFALPEGGSLPQEVWRRRHTAILWLLALHIAIIFLFGVARGSSIPHALLESGVVAAFAAAGLWRSLGNRLRSAMAVLGLLSSSAILVHLSGGSIEMHFHFFVMVVVIALYQDWVPFLLAIAYVVIHHGTIGVIDPTAVYNHPAAWASPWKWSAIHGLFILAASVASLIAWRFTERSRARSQLILDSAGEGIYGMDCDGRATFVNPAAAQMLGYRVEELVGKKINHLIRGPSTPGAANHGSGASSKEFAEDNERGAREDTFHRKDGSRFPVRWFGTPILERGRIIGSVTTFRDVTDEHQLEARLRQSQKMEAIGQLAGGVAHDFNNLLQVILNYADFLEEDLGDDPRAADVKAIRGSGERAARLVSQLLAFSRKDVTNRVALDLSTAIQDMNELLRRTIRSDIEMKVDLSPELDAVLIDPHQVQQLVVNLVVNARDAMPAGGKLTIRTFNVEIDEDFARAHPGLSVGPNVCLSVADTGHGMTEEVRTRVFEPFFTTKPRGSGTGLGLSTVYGIVKASDGHISVYSEPGLGTVFSVYLPATDQAAMPSPPRGAPMAAGGRGETILVAEDEDNVRELVERILTNNGYHVLAAPSGNDALRVSREHPGTIDLLLTDLIMPGMSGTELSRAINGSRKEMRTVHMSGYPDDVITHHGMGNVRHYLPKPFNTAALLAKVREALDSEA